MRTHHHWFIVGLLTFNAVGCALASEAQINQPRSPIQGAVPSSEWNWGMWTNGVCGEAAVQWHGDRDKLPNVEVRVVGTNTESFFGVKDLWDEHEAFRWIFEDEGLCYEATNRFCGPIELRDSLGKALLCIKAEGLPQAYPSSYSLRDARENSTNNISPTRTKKGTHFPRRVRSLSTLADFKLDDYFDIKKPGDYILTVWPKFYRRPTTNDDICQRVDLPPVSVTISWHPKEGRDAGTP